MATPTIIVALTAAKHRLRDAGVESYALDADLLMALCLSKTREQLLLEQDSYYLSQQECTYFEQLVQRRVKREPLSHILGKREFWGRDFSVSSDVLDPRPDSETLIEAVLNRYRKHHGPLRILELGVGSGCLAITLLCEMPEATAVGVDISEAALAVASQNRQTYGLQQRLELLHGSWLSPVIGVFDLVISNPPYIREGDYPTLQAEVTNYEPKLALCAGDDGLDCYRDIAGSLKSYLADSGRIFLEGGIGQSTDIASIFESVGCIFETVHNDISGIDRVTELRH